MKKNINWEQLQKNIKGKVVTASSSNFAEARSDMVWNNVKPDRSPEVIVKVKHVQDVVESINFARDNCLKVVAHGGGHTWCGLAVRNGGMTIDLSALNEVKIDKKTKKAVIQPVISNRDLARLLAKEGLAFPIGHCPTVKAGGYLLNGGMSWNMGHWGPACFSVEAIEFVTADGKMITASEKEHPDLFWAGRGCGPGMFAVATRFHLKCYDLPQGLMTSNYYYSLDDLKEVVKEVVDLGWTMPDFVELSIFLIKAPPQLKEKCKNHNGKLCMITAVAFAGSKEEGQNALKILEKSKLANKCLSKSLFDPATFATLADASGATWPENHRNLCENQCSKADPVEIITSLKDKFIEAPSPKSVIVFCQSTGGHNLLQERPDVALSMDAKSYGGIWSIWEEAKDDAANFKWHYECWDILKKHTSRPYIGETDIVQDPGQVKKAYSQEKWQKLEQIRAKYDPQGLFFGFLGGLERKN